jgi:hypothetical protein
MFGTKSLVQPALLGLPNGGASHSYTHCDTFKLAVLLDQEYSYFIVFAL